MMATHHIISVSEAKVDDRNGNNHNEHPNRQEEIIVEKIALGTFDKRVATENSNVSSQTFDGFNNFGVMDSVKGVLTPEVAGLSSVLEKSSGLSSSEVESKEIDKVKNSRPQLGQVKAKPKNFPAPKNASSTSNGTETTNSGQEQPVVKDRLPNNGLADSNMNKTIKIRIDAVNSKEVKPDSASLTENVAQSEGIRQKAKLRPLSKGPPIKAKGESEATLSPSSEDAKPNIVGKLPSYSFSFRCEERAERRKEFYSKLEEKIHVKEVEKSNLQAKSKEIQAADIKMLRKSLTFKATPMPSFYQEPAPAKVELKKIPLTRPRSPKLGRNKSSSTEDAEGGNDNINRLRRLSLDQRIAQNKPTKAPSPARTKKPYRRSLPRLPSEKSSLQNSAEETTLQTPEHESATKRGTTLVKEENEHETKDDGDTTLVHGHEPLVYDNFQPDHE